MDNVEKAMDESTCKEDGYEEDGSDDKRDENQWEIKGGCNKKEYEKSRYSESYDFQDYCAQNWPEHFRKADIHESLEEFSLSLSLFETDSSRFRFWFPIYWLAQSYDVRDGSDSITSWSGLHLAANAGHKKIAQHLLDSGKIDINSRDSNIKPALFYAVKGNHCTVVQLLLDQGADPNLYCGILRSILVSAASDGNEMIIRLLLEKGANDYNQALYEAVSHGNVEIVQLLIEKGANSYNDALRKAASHGHLEIVRLLIKEGAENYNGALLEAVRCGAAEIVQLLIEEGADDYNSALRQAAAYGNQQLMDFMINKGADDYNGALRETAARESWNMVPFLIEKGADDYNGGLRIAAYKGEKEMVLFLMKKGADDYSGALQAAVEALQEVWEHEMWILRPKRGDLKRVINLLEKNIRYLNQEGSKRTGSPNNDSNVENDSSFDNDWISDNDSNTTEYGSHPPSESTQQDDLDLVQEPDQAQNRLRTHSISHGTS